MKSKDNVQSADTMQRKDAIDLALSHVAQASRLLQFYVALNILVLGGLLSGGFADTVSMIWRFGIAVVYVLVSIAFIDGLDSFAKRIEACYKVAQALPGDKLTDHDFKVITEAPDTTPMYWALRVTLIVVAAAIVFYK